MEALLEGRPKGRPPRRRRAGFTLIELMVSLSLTSMFMVGLMATYKAFGSAAAKQNNVTRFQSSYRAAVHQIARDIRAAGANPTSNPWLFDGDPVTDVALELDPDGDDDVSNSLLVRMDVRGADGSESDGDATDKLEIVYYHYVPRKHALFRHTWQADGEVPFDLTEEHLGTLDSSLIEADQVWSEIPFLEETFLSDVCDFKFTFLDSDGSETTAPQSIIMVKILLVAASEASECDVDGAVLREMNTVVRLRNR